jgi:glycosyltransferase involved in cell wall biosynthesis
MGNLSNPVAMSVIIATKNNCEALEHCLDALQRQTLSPDTFEVLVVDDGSDDTTWTMLQARAETNLKAFRQHYRGSGASRNRALEHATGTLILFLKDDIRADTKLLETHIQTHQTRPENQLCVMGTCEQEATSLCNPLVRYVAETGLLHEYSQLLPMDYVDARHCYSDNLSISRKNLMALGGLDDTLHCADLGGFDLGFRLEQSGHKLLFNPSALGMRATTYTLENLQSRIELRATGWVDLFRKYPERLREWGDLRTSTLIELEDNVAIYAPKAAERLDIVTQLSGFHFDSDPVNPVSSPDTQRRILKTIDEQMQPLNALWWSQGFADGLYTHGLDGFGELLERAGRVDDLIPQRTLMLLQEDIHPIELQAIYNWSMQHDEHTAGGLVIALDSNDANALDAIATQIACAVTRGRPDSKPAAIHFILNGRRPEELKPLFLATDRWLARPGPWERSLVTTALEEGCSVDWVPDSGVVPAPNLPGNLRIGLWPDWNNYTDLLFLIDKWWPALSARNDCSLVLFHSKEKTSRAKRSAQTLQELLDESANGDHTANVITALAPEKAAAQSYWRQHLDGIIQLESGHTPKKMNWLNTLGSRAFLAPIDLERHLVNLHLLTDQLLGHAPTETYTDPYQEVHEQIS